MASFFKKLVFFRAGFLPAFVGSYRKPLGLCQAKKSVVPKTFLTEA